MYWGNWCDTVEAKMSTSGVPLIWYNFMKMVNFTSHLLESRVWMDSLSASAFIDPGSNRDLSLQKVFPNFFADRSRLLVFDTPFFIKYDRAIMLPIRIWTDIASLSFKVKDIITDLTALSSKTFMWNFQSSTDHAPYPHHCCQAVTTHSPVL